MIFVIVLQQIDGNIIAPKILGDQLGLSAFWIMSAVFIGGGLFGLFGMIIASPTFAVIYSICSEFVSVRLEAKGMSADTASYMEPVDSDKPKKPEQTAPESVEASQSQKSAKK